MGTESEQPVTGERIRATILAVLEELAGRGQGLQSATVLQHTEAQLGGRLPQDIQQAILTVWYDLFRQGLLAWGHNLSNPDAPFCHLTDRGRDTLRQLDRDPANPDGYLNNLAQRGPLNPVAQSYVDEALGTYGAGFSKACAVMIGVAAESLVLEVRDKIVARLGGHGRAVPRGLTDWRVRTVLTAIETELRKHTGEMPRRLAEDFQAYWPAFTQSIRVVRNDAGHPTSVTPVSPEAVHAALLLFPELVALASSLRDWIHEQMP